MLVGFTSEQDESGKQIAFYHDLDKGIRKYFEQKTYGESVQIFAICFICIDFVKAKKHLEAGFSKERKPRYKEKQKSITMDIRFDGSILVSNSLSENISLLESKVIEYLDKIDKYKETISGFDLELFKKDFIYILKKEMNNVRIKYRI